jgi:hypothetical protein
MDRVVREFLTPAEGVVEMVAAPPSLQSSGAAGKVRETPAMLLPRMVSGRPPVLDLVEAHLLAGSERMKEADGSLGDYVDGCENHFLLANGYSALAAVVCGGDPNRFAPGPIMLFENTRRSRVIMESENRSLPG